MTIPNVQNAPLKRSPPPPFIVTRRGRCTCTGERGSRRFPPNHGGAVVEYCGKYNVGHGIGRGSRPGYRPWSSRDRAGVLPAPAGGVVVAVGHTVLQAWRGGAPRVLQAGVLPWSGSGPLLKAMPMLFEGSAEGKARGKYGELAAQWLEQCRARLAQHRRFPSGATASEMAEQ